MRQELYQYSHLYARKLFLQNSASSTVLQLIFTSLDAVSHGLCYKNGLLLFSALSASDNLYSFDLLVIAFFLLAIAYHMDRLLHMLSTLRCCVQLQSSMLAKPSY